MTDRHPVNKLIDFFGEKKQIVADRLAEVSQTVHAQSEHATFTKRFLNVDQSVILKEKAQAAAQEIRTQNESSPEKKRIYTLILHAFEQLIQYEELAGLKTDEMQNFMGIVGKEVTQATVVFLHRIRELSDPQKFNSALDRFWLRRVNRPIVSFKDEELPLPLQTLSDRVLNSEYGSYGLLFDFDEKRKPQLENTDPKKFVSAFIYEQLLSLTIRRRVDDGSIQDGHSHVHLPESNVYYVVVHEGSVTKRVPVPADYLQAPVEVFHTNFQKLLENAIVIDMDFNHNSFEESFEGRKEVQLWHNEKRKETATATTADVSVTIARDDEMTIDHLQRDKRNYTHGSSIPVALRVGINENGKICGVGAKVSHPWADGEKAVQEIEEVMDMVMGYDLSPDATSKPYEHVNQFSYLDRKNVVVTTEIPVTSQLDIRNKVNELFEFFSQRLPAEEQIKPSINTILQYAAMLTLNTTHMHFVEQNAEKGEIGPAISVLPKEVMEYFQNLKTDDTRPSVIKQKMRALFKTFNHFDYERKEVRAGRGSVAIMATMSEGLLEALLRPMALMMDRKKTEMLVKSVLSSQFVGAKEAYQTQYRQRHQENKSVSLAWFSGAFADTYPEKSVAFCEKPDGTIRATLRLKVDDPRMEEKFQKEFQQNVVKILGMLTAYKNIREQEMNSEVSQS